MAGSSHVYGTGANLISRTVIFGIEEAVKEAQNGGSGVVIYFRKEGRALGEVTKVRITQDSVLLGLTNSRTVS